jgi:hypothetical protein
MKEVLPGIFFWRQTHPKIKIPVSSYYLKPEHVLIDPLVPDEGIEWFAADPPENIYMSIRHHYRHCGEFAARYDCAIWCVEQGMHEFTRGETVRPFQFGDMLPGDVKAIEIGSICPDESALFIDREGGCVVLADGCVRRGDGPLQFVPDKLLGDDPEAVKAGLRAAYTRLLENYAFTTLLLAHGQPMVGDGRVALEQFVSG